MSDSFTVKDLSKLTHAELVTNLMEVIGYLGDAGAHATEADERAAEALKACTDLLVDNALLRCHMRVLTDDHARMTDRTEARSQSRSWSWWARLCGSSD
jgi:hypothetical protein